MNIYTQTHQDYFAKLMEDWVMPDDWFDDIYEGVTLMGYAGWNKGISPSEETKRLISETNKKRGINFVSNGATEAARQACLGKKQSPEHIAQRVKAKQKKVCVEGVIYNSLTEAAESLGVHITAISGRLTRGKSAYYV